MPNEFVFNLESSVRSANPVRQTVEFFNYLLDDFEEVDFRILMGLGDRTIQITPAGDPARFVEEGAGNVKARVIFTKKGLARGIQAFVDQANWTIGN